MKKEYKIIVDNQKVSVVELNAEYSSEYVEELLNRISELELMCRNYSAVITEKDNKIKELEVAIDDIKYITERF